MMCGIKWWILSDVGRKKTEISVGRFPPWLGMGASKFYDWRQRYGRVNEHNGWIPRDFWLEGWGEGSHHRFSSAESLGGLSAADVHDAGRGGGGGEPGGRVASVAASRTAVAMEGQALAQGDGVRAAAAAAPALAHRCFLYHPVGHVLLPVQRVGWI